MERIAFIFEGMIADQMVEITHLHNEPWDKTLKEKGEDREIDYLLAVDGVDSISVEEAKQRMEEIAEMHNLFGTV